MPTTYTVSYNETIGDVIMNSTGNINNWSLILDANGYDDWTPMLAAGDVLIIPDDVVMDLNTMRQLATYPSNNGSVPDVFDKISVIWGILSNNWILQTGLWNGSAVWTPDGLWNTQ